MLEIKKILFQIENNIGAIINDDAPVTRHLWKLLLEQHPADIAMLISRIDDKFQAPLLKKLPIEKAKKVFLKISENIQASLIIQLDIDKSTTLLHSMSADELTDIFDYLSDEDLEKYLKLLQQKQRSKIISLLSFPSESAGGRMNSEVITLQSGFTVKKTIELLQRLNPKKELIQRIYVTTKEGLLIGHITLDTLVFNKPDVILEDVFEKNELLIHVDEDQEEVANQIAHYGLPSAPVIDKQGHFLGVITASDVVEIIKEEESEDAYKRFGLSTVEHNYFSTPTWHLIIQRGSWLVGLLLLQSISSFILGKYNFMIEQYAVLSIFLGMITGTGGNAGNQAATLVIRGLTTHEMNRNNILKVFFREFGIALIIASILFLVGFLRVYYSFNLMSALAINASLFVIVVFSTILGSIIPVILQFLGFDPAHSAAPFLATLMDILGVLIYCLIFYSIMCY
jgi:magnesium transporter